MIVACQAARAMTAGKSSAANSSSTRHSSQRTASARASIRTGSSQNGHSMVIIWCLLSSGSMPEASGAVVTASVSIARETHGELP